MAKGRRAGGGAVLYRLMCDWSLNVPEWVTRGGESSSRTRGGEVQKSLRLGSRSAWRCGDGEEELVCFILVAYDSGGGVLPAEARRSARLAF